MSIPCSPSSKSSRCPFLLKKKKEKKSQENADEMERYATELDVDFVRRAVRCIGRCAISIESTADRCIEALISLIQTQVNYVVQEAIVVIKVNCVFKKKKTERERKRDLKKALLNRIFSEDTLIGTNR